MSSRPEREENDRGSPINMPREIGGYQIQRILGSGGMATVYAALQTQPRRTVAIKVLRTAPNDEAALRRFRREVEILGRLRHPVIAQVFSAGVHEEGGRVPFFVMEYIPGSRTITDYADQKNLTIPERLRLFCKVCAGVEYGHKHRVIHRDLKPGNILINENGEPKIIDFGVARVAEVDVQTQTLHTEQGRLIGTIQYMAPEQLDATMPDIDARCDVYALGVLLYRLLTGRAPHELSGLTLFTAAQVIRRDQPALPSAARAELKGDLDVIVMKALANDRRMRYPSSAELARDVLRFLGNKPIEARPAGAIYRIRLFARRHRPWVIGGSVAATIMIAAVALLIIQRWWLLRDRPTSGEGPSPIALADPGAALPGPGANESTPPAGTTVTQPGSIVAAGAPTTLTRSGDARTEVVLPAGHAGAITALAFDPSGTLLASAGADLKVLVWDVPGAKVRAGADQTQSAARLLRFARNERVVLALLSGRRVARVDAESGRLMPLGPTLDVDVRDMAVHPFTNQIAYSGDDSTARVTGPAGRRELIRRGTRGAYGALAFSRDGRSLAGGSDRGALTQWSLEDEKAVRSCEAGSAPVLALACTAAESIVALLGDGSAVDWHPALAPARASSAPLRIGAADGSGVEAAPVVIAATIDADGRLGAVLTDAGVAFHDFASGSWREVMITTLPTEQRAIIALSADGARLALGSSEGTIRIVPVPSETP